MTTSVQMQLRRDTAANIAVNTGAQGEPWWDITNNRLVGNDGTTAGGYPHALVANLPFGGFQNLLLGNTAGPQSFAAPTTPNNQVKITADYLSLFNPTLGVSYLASSVAVTVDVTTSGAGGLDSGSVAASTWYSVWVIYKPGTGLAALLSTSTTSPTLPSGYTYKMRVGFMRTDASSHFMRVLQIGNRAQYVLVASSNTTAYPQAATGVAGNVNSAGGMVSVAMAAFVPPTAAGVRLFLNVSVSTAGGMVGPNNNFGTYDSSTNPAPIMLANNGNNPVNAISSMLLEGASIFWATSGGGSSLCIVGWEDNL